MTSTTTALKLPDNTVGVQAGDVLCVRTSGLAAEVINFGSTLLGEPGLDNHIAVLDHIDAKSTWWCLEGRPGGVGWRDATGYLMSQYTVTNRHQPKTDEQRTEICYWMNRLINTKYDWDAIVGDDLRDLHLPAIPDPWSVKDTNGEISGHVVCSSSAVFAYQKAPCAYPRYAINTNTEPSDWVKFILDNNYA
jgi:hypothetical protein